MGVAIPLDDLNFSALASFRYGLRKFLRFSKDLLARQAKLSPEQYEALLALKTSAAADGLTVGQLSERLQVKHHTMVSLTDRLVSRKLVTKQRGEVDRRHVYVKLTPSGGALIEQLATAHARELRSRSSELIAALERL